MTRRTTRMIAIIGLSVFSMVFVAACEDDPEDLDYRNAVDAATAGSGGAGAAAVDASTAGTPAADSGNGTDAGDDDGGDAG